MNKEIKYHLINSAIAGALVCAGSLTTVFSGEPTFKSILIGLGAGIVAGLIVFLNKFKDYWNSKKSKLMNFI